jgi:hypothetical protein
MPILLPSNGNVAAAVSGGQVMDICDAVRPDRLSEEHVVTPPPGMPCSMTRVLSLGPYDDGPRLVTTKKGGRPSTETVMGRLPSINS